MSIPNKLSEIINKCLIAVQLHPQHDLNLGYRHLVWASLEAQDKSGQSLDPLGRKRRTFLAILTARYVLPIWEQVRPTDKVPHQLLMKAEQILNDELDPKDAQEDVGNLWTYMDDITLEIGGSDLAIAGYGAVMALSTALWDEKFDPVKIDYNLTDADIDPYEFDVSFIASSTYANGAVWEASSDAEKRREFWEWWLTQAVPAAWSAFPEDG